MNEEKAGPLVRIGSVIIKGDAPVSKGLYYDEEAFLRRACSIGVNIHEGQLRRLSMRQQKYLISYQMAVLGALKSYVELHEFCDLFDQRSHETESSNGRQTAYHTIIRASELVDYFAKIENVLRMYPGYKKSDIKEELLEQLVSVRKFRNRHQHIKEIEKRPDDDYFWGALRWERLTINRTNAGHGVIIYSGIEEDQPAIVSLPGEGYFIIGCNIGTISMFDHEGSNVILTKVFATLIGASARVEREMIAATDRR